MALDHPSRQQVEAASDHQRLQEVEVAALNQRPRVQEHPVAALKRPSPQGVVVALDWRLHQEVVDQAPTTDDLLARSWAPKMVAKSVVKTVAKMMPT